VSNPDLHIRLDGTTVSDVLLQSLLEIAAAMEPAVHRRDDADSAVEPMAVVGAAMEPAVYGRDDPG